MRGSSRPRQSGADPDHVRVLLLAPVIFAAHVAEEAPGLVAWFETHVQPHITTGQFWSVNAAGFAITLLVALGGRTLPLTASAALATAWLGFVMLANGIFHLVATIYERGYVPGVVTGTLLYLPYFVWLARRIVRGGALRPVTVALLAVAGGAPMAVHGYRIVFLGTRLF